MAKKSSGAAPSVASQAAAGMRAHGTGFSGGQTVSTIQAGNPMNFNNNPTAQQEDFTPRSYRTKSTKQG